MVTCSVIDCCTTQYNNPEKCSFHRFPTNLDTRNVWLRLIGRLNWIPKKNSCVCSKHFEEKCLQTRGAKQMLMKSAIPTKFVPCTRPREKSATNPSISVRPYKEFVLPLPMKRIVSHLSASEKLSIINVYKYVTDSWPVDKYRSKKEMKKKTACILGISLATVYRVLKQYVDTDTTVMPAALKRRHSNRDKVNHSNNVTSSNLGNVDGGASSKNQTVDYAQIAQCSNCKESINGSVYTCVQCVYVMCASCDMDGAHAHHYVLRAPPGRTREEVQTVTKEVTEVLAPILEHFNDRLPDAEEASTSPFQTDVVIKEELDIEENDPLQQLEMRQAGVGAADVGCAGDARRDGCDAPVAGTSKLQVWPSKFIETFIKKENDPDEEENQSSLTPHIVTDKSEPVEYEVNVKVEAIVPQKRKRKAKGQDSDDLDDSSYFE